FTIGSVSQLGDLHGAAPSLERKIDSVVRGRRQPGRQVGVIYASGEPDPICRSYCPHRCPFDRRKAREVDGIASQTDWNWIICERYIVGKDRQTGKIVSCSQSADLKSKFITNQLFLGIHLTQVISRRRKGGGYLE